MDIALLGVSGRVGSRLLAELLRRGHRVTGIARDTGKLAGHDAVISALKFATTDAATLLAAVKQQAEVKRLLVVGGAPSLMNWKRRSIRGNASRWATDRSTNEGDGDN